MTPSIELDGTISHSDHLDVNFYRQWRDYADSGGNLSYADWRAALIRACDLLADAVSWGWENGWARLAEAPVYGEMTRCWDAVRPASALRRELKLKT